MDKVHILREIKRAAEANGGAPLGMQRFASATGIKMSDWFGIYRARWSDAIAEAGLVPNQLQGAYERTDLLEKYATLAQKLGRLPVSGDLRIEARKNPEFPAHTTFGRLGPKSTLITELAEYCRSRSGFEDVLRWCDESQTNGSTPRAPKPDDVEFGFVYRIKSGRFYKIGRSNAAGRRHYELDIQLPERATMVHVIRTDDPNGIEVYWHKRFEAKRKNGEWFQLNADNIAAFKRRKFM